MYNRTLCALLAILLLGAIPAQAADSAPLQSGQIHSSMINPFDSTTWMKHSGGEMRFNFAHPAGWMVFINPETNSIALAALMNPANYTQFVQPQFWMQFTNPNNIMAWMNPASYATFFNPATFQGWMRSEPYTHFIDPGMYMQISNPAAYAPLISPALYLRWLDPAAYAVPSMRATGGPATFNWFDYNTWYSR